MKTMRKLMALVLTFALALTLAIPAFAAGSTNRHIITINNESANQHTYQAYQVFAGEYDSTAKNLSNITWGSGVKGADLLTALTKDTTHFQIQDPANPDDTTAKVNAFAGCSDAAAVAKVLADNKDTATFAQNFADVVSDYLKDVAGTSTAKAATAPATGYTYSISVLGDGYYFIKDKDKSLDSVEGDSYTDYILQVVGDVTMTAKSDSIIVEKTAATGGYDCGKAADHWYDADGKEVEVKDGDPTDGLTQHKHSIEKCGLAYADSNTAQINDIVSFKLESTVPAEAAAYDYYYFIFGDTLSEGLTYDSKNANMVVTFYKTADGKTTATTATKDTDYTVRDGDNKYGTYTFAVALKDAKAHAGEKVVVTYEATVNERAVIGLNGNANEVVVEYSKDPNESYGGIPGNPPTGFPAKDQKTPDGKTPEDITKTFVTKINILKVDGTDNTKTLAGATFTLTGTTESVIVRTKDVYTAVTDETTIPDGTKVYYKLMDGKYTDQKAQPEEMVTQTDRTKGGYVVCEADDAGVKYTINNVSYREATQKDMDDTSVALYVYMASNEYLYESTTQKYTYKSETTYECTPKAFSATGTTDADGNLVFTGLNAGTYTITEIKAPTGYNLLKDPITVVIECDLPDSIQDGTETCTWTYTGSDNKTAGVVQTDGTVEITVVNNIGSELPSTGGIGTTIFYAVGAVLVIGAGVLLITKKRMLGAED